MSLEMSIIIWCCLCIQMLLQVSDAAWKHRKVRGWNSAHNHHSGTVEAKDQFWAHWAINFPRLTVPATVVAATRQETTQQILIPNGGLQCFDGLITLAFCCWIEIPKRHYHLSSFLSNFPLFSQVDGDQDTCSTSPPASTSMLSSSEVSFLDFHFTCLD